MPNMNPMDMDCCSCCTCCDCDCEEERKISKNETCFGCWPLSSGITWIGVVLSAWYAYCFIDSFMLQWNDYVDGYFILVNFLILIPATVAIVLFWVFARKKDKDSRMVGAYAIAIIFLVVIAQIGWVCWYYNNAYSEPEVMEGYGSREDGKYKATSKKWYGIRKIAEGFVLFFVFFYFFNVQIRWAELNDGDKKSKK